MDTEGDGKRSAAVGSVKRNEEQHGMASNTVIGGGGGDFPDEDSSTLEPHPVPTVATAAASFANKKRRIDRVSFPDLTAVQLKPLDSAMTKPVPAQVPKFLYYAIFGDEVPLAQEGCPFKKCIPLWENSWQIEGEPSLLLERPSYPAMLDFVESRFADFKSFINVKAVITGTAGTGKTMFLLYVARHFVRQNHLVVMYIGTQFYIISMHSPAELRKDHPEAPKVGELKLKKIQLSVPFNGHDSFWFARGTDAVQSEGDLALLYNALRCGRAITLRDSGNLEKEIPAVDASGPILYTISTWQEGLLSLLKNKTTINAKQFIRYADLWEGMECLWCVKVGAFGEKEFKSENIEAYLKEGYRRYGGSARKVFAFARDQEQNQTAVGNLTEMEFDSDDSSKITIIAENQVTNKKERAKATALVFHQSPFDGGKKCKVHMASSYIAALLMKHVQSNEVKDLRNVVATLSVTDGKQAAHGVLYEEEAHQDFFCRPVNKNHNLRRLGHHPPSADSKQRKTKQLVAKGSIDLKLSRNTVVHFPGKSLENAIHGLADDDNILDIYFHPLSSNFPTHDSFIFCKASELFDVDGSGKADKVAEAKTLLEQQVVLVGLQMTVSKSDTSDKPSHTVVGEHLKDHLEGAMQIANKIDPSLVVLPDVVTVFLSPTESCRKAVFMPVLYKNGKPLDKAISSFGGVAPQYCTVYEVPLIRDLMSPTSSTMITDTTTNIK